MRVPNLGNHKLFRNMLDTGTAYFNDNIKALIPILKLVYKNEPLYVRTMDDDVEPCPLGL
jgi:hypothetical protein